MAYDGVAQGQQRAFRRIAEKGMQSVEKLLMDRSLLPPAWVFTVVSTITPNGVVLVGRRKYKENGGYETQTRAWRAVIPRGNLF